jgi:hypothetical protein
MTFETKLLSLPLEKWKTRLAIIFDWYDGPRAGLCSLEVPEVEFSFKLLDERTNEDTADDRLFRLSELPAGSVAEALALLRDLGYPTGPFWVPIWRFPSDAERLKAEDQLRRIEEQRRPTQVVIFTRDMVEFLGCWRVGQSERNGVDWFAELNLPQQQPG